MSTNQPCALQRAEVLACCKALLSELLDVPADNLSEEDELVGDLGLESLQVLELVSLAEDAYTITIDVTVADPLVTVGQLVDQVLTSSV